MSDFEKLKVDHAKLRVLYFQKEAGANEFERKYQEAIEERDMYFAVLGTRGEALRNMEDENTTLKEENARLKATVARGGSSSDAKNLKTVNTTLMRQNTELKQENGELKKENKEVR